MTKRLTTLILLLILIPATFVRFYKLGMSPKGLYLDEAAQGYNAYSILKTGKDEFGKTLPIVFRSFNDFKTPVYTYLIVPLIPIFGLTEFTVRLPSFIFSILTIVMFYLLINELTPKKYSIPFTIISCILLAISPWHILFARASFESNISIFFTISGIYFFYAGLKKPNYLILSSILLAISIHSYHAQRVVTPLIILILFCKYRIILLSKSHRNILLISLLAGFLILLPIFSIITTPGFLARAAGLNIFSLTQSPGMIENYEGIYSSLINSRLYLSTREFFALYVSYFSPRNLFILGDYDIRSSYPELSTFFLWQYLFYLIGIYQLITSKTLGALRFITITLLLISPLPAAITRDAYTTIRAFQMVIPLNVVIALGILETYNFLAKAFTKETPKKVFSLFAVTLITFISIYSLARIYSSAIILNKHYREEYWNYGFYEVVKKINSFDNQIPIVFDNTRTEAYIELLFFLKHNPSNYQEKNKEVTSAEYYTNMKRGTTKTIGNITTRPIKWEIDTKEEKYLIGDSLSISEDQIKEHDLELIDKILYPSGSLAFIIVKTNP